MVIPLHIINRTVLPVKTRVELTVVFTLGSFAIIVVVLRMLIVLTHWTQQNKLVWGQLECFTATVIANAPILHGLWRHAWMHLCKFNFRQGDNCPPAYNMAIQRPTEQTEPGQAATEDLPVPEKRGSRARQSVSRPNGAQAQYSVLVNILTRLCSAPQDQRSLPSISRRNRNRAVSWASSGDQDRTTRARKQWRTSVCWIGTGRTDHNAHWDGIDCW